MGVEVLLNKKIVIIFAIFICLLSTSAIFASDNLTLSDVETSDNLIFVEEVNLDEDKISADQTDSFTTSDGIDSISNSSSFAYLNNLINSGNDSTVYLDRNITYDENDDSCFVNGIVIDRPLNIFGNGYTINGANKARIFNITSDNVFLRGINFINANSYEGGAIIGDSYGVIECNFSNNTAERFGGALTNANAENCVFIENYARSGGAMYKGSATNCKFIKNSASSTGGAVYDVYLFNCTLMSNTAKLSGAMDHNSAVNCSFIDNQATTLSGALGNGYAVDCIFINNSAAYSGAIGADSSASNCIFIGNYANEGGAVFSCYVVNSTFKRNHAQRGGAISTGSALNCIFEDNYAQEFGGSIFSCDVKNCNFTNNTALNGGAMYKGSAIDCIFINNIAIGLAGAIASGDANNCQFIDNFANIAGALSDGSAVNCIFERNHADNGGSLYISSAMGCTFIENHAIEGGALYSSSAVDCLFERNYADYGGAIAHNSSAIASTFINNTAFVSGGANYESSIVNCVLKGNLPKYKLYVSDFEAIYGFGGELTVKLSDSDNNFISGVNTLINIYNRDDELCGSYSCLSGYNLFIDLGVGEYRAVVSVNDNNYNVDPINVSINIKKSTSIYVVSVTSVYNVNNPLIVNLHDSDGVILKNTQVSITFNGATKTYKTNSNGQVLLSTKTLAPKTYSVSIKYLGSSGYVPSSATSKIIVKKAKPIFIAPNRVFKVKTKIKTYYLTFKNNVYQVMKNTKLSLRVNAVTYYAKTNSKGQATFKITKLNKKGIFQGTLKFDGNKYYTALSKKVKITVKL